MVSSYDLYAPPWATTSDREFRGQDEFPFSAGEFVWTGFDYLGEPTPYNADASNLLNFTDPAGRARMEAELESLGKLRVPSRSSYFGVVDLAGFKKDRFYIYQARWRPELPMAHLLPHRNWPGREGRVTPVHVYTSADEAELFLNGRSLGRKRRGAFEYRLRRDDVAHVLMKMRPRDGLVEDPANNWCLADARGEAVLVYTPSGASVTLAATLPRKSYAGLWFDPRTGETRPLDAPRAWGKATTFAKPTGEAWLLLLTGQHRPR